jgi:hypothetical protein
MDPQLADKIYESCFARRKSGRFSMRWVGTESVVGWMKTQQAVETTYV